MYAFAFLYVSLEKFLVTNESGIDDGVSPGEEIAIGKPQCARFSSRVRLRMYDITPMTRRRRRVREFSGRVFDWIPLLRLSLKWLRSLSAARDRDDRERRSRTPARILEILTKAERQGALAGKKFAYSQRTECRSSCLFYPSRDVIAPFDFPEFRTFLSNKPMVHI